MEGEILIVIMIAYISFVLVTLLMSLKQIEIMRKKKIEKKAKFISILAEGLKNNNITNLTDVINIYLPIAGEEKEEADYTETLNKYLREFLVELNSKREKVIGKLDIKTKIEWKNKVTDFIKENEEISPYEFLPFTERNILTDMDTFIEKKDTKSAKDKVSELATLLIVRNDELFTLRRRYSWTLVLSIVSVILTIYFGVTALKLV